MKRAGKCPRNIQIIAASTWTEPAHPHAPCAWAWAVPRVPAHRLGLGHVPARLDWAGLDLAGQLLDFFFFFNFFIFLLGFWKVESWTDTAPHPT